MIDRRQLLLATGASALLAACDNNKAGGEPLAIMTPFGFIPDFLEMMNMMTGGHLAAQGFAGELLGGQGTSGAIQQLLAGRASFARITPVDQFLSAAKGNSTLVSVATLYQGSTFNFVSPTEKPIKTPADLAGKTIGIVSVGGSTEIILDLILAQAGIAKDQVKREVTGNSPGAFELVKQGRVDGFFCTIGVVTALTRSGVTAEIWNTDRFALMPSQVYVTTRDVIAQKPETVTWFLKALSASAKEILTGDVKALYTRAASKYEIAGIKDLDGLAAIMANTFPLWMAEGESNFLRNVPSRWEAASKALKAAGIADLGDGSTLYTNQFIDAALKG